jgi:hypothetical protein
MTSDTLIAGIWLIVTFGIIVSGHNLKNRNDTRTFSGYIFRVIFWPLMLAFALLNGCFFAVLVFVKIMWFAVNDMFGLDVSGRR